MAQSLQIFFLNKRMSIFQDYLGNKSALGRLEKMIEKTQVPHLLLFSGIEGIGKRSIAMAFARRWLQNTSDRDLHLLKPEGKTGMLSIKSVRRVIETLNLSPFVALGKVAIFDEAERMLPTSANALLKILEEPPADTLI